MASSPQLKETPGDAHGARQNPLRGLVKNPIVLGILVVLVAGGLFFGVRYAIETQTKISIETAEISAPLIGLGPETPGILKTVYVNEGDRVSVGQQLFNVGDRVTVARSAGIVTTIQNTPGQWASNASVIVQMYDPTTLRLVGHLQEDQGLSEVKVGQKVSFTLDAYGGQSYAGSVESIAKTADQASIAFSISDKRVEKQYAVKAVFDVNAYPEIRNGMSARMTIFK